MDTSGNSVAMGAPGIEPRWTSSAKEGVGTAYHTSCRLWFTLSHGIINEIYYPHVDQPNTRDFQFLITDGESFCHEEKRDLTHQIEYPERDAELEIVRRHGHRPVLPKLDEFGLRAVAGIEAVRESAPPWLRLRFPRK